MDHSQTYLAMGNLACTLHQLDELFEAKGLGVQVLDWRKAHLGPGHRLMEDLAYTLRKLGEVREAEELFSQVEELRGATKRPSPGDSTVGVISSPSDL
jgi:hypothetical protein